MPHGDAPTCTTGGASGPADLALKLLAQAAKLGNPPAMLEAARLLLEQATRPAAPLRIAESG